MTRRIAAGVFVVVAWTAISPARSAEITVFTSRAVATVLAEIGPQFEVATKNKLNVVVDLTPTLVKRFRAGDAADIVIALPELIDELVKDGLLVARTRSDLVRSGLGLEMRSDAQTPRIDTLDEFKTAILGAKSIGYLKTPAGAHLDKVFDRLGVLEKILPKTIRPDTDIVSELVAKGDLEMGIVVVTQILTTPGVKLVGKLPEELQYYVNFAGAVATNSKYPLAAGSLLDHLKSPSAKPVLTIQGMDPG
jgi:molybdate transport system substrate-binding protein